MAHRFTFDVWPADANERTLPLVVARWGNTAAATLEAVKADMRDGATVTPRTHNRAQCEPPHPGTN